MTLFNEAITIERSTEAVSDSGAVISDWQPRWRSVWANVEHLQGDEYWSGAQVVIARLVVFKIRYSSDIALIDAARYRIAHGGRTYDIQSVIPAQADAPIGGPARRELHIRCVQHD